MPDYTQRTIERYRKNADEVNGLLNGLKDSKKLQTAMEELENQLDDIQFQPRYRLMLYLSEHWNDPQTAPPIVTMQSAKNASNDELAFYAEKLSQLTKRDENRNVSPRKSTFLDCLKENRTDETTWGNIALGLRLNCRETERLFLRVLPSFDGFHFRKIDELCLVFALELQKTISEYNNLLTNCRKILKNCQKQKAPVDGYPYSTAAARKDFFDLVDQWRENPDQQEENFLQWVKENWQFFDNSRHTARYVYYALAQLCTKWNAGNLCAASKKNVNCPTLFSTIRPISRMVQKKQLAQSREEAAQIADQLLALAESYQGWLAFQGAAVQMTPKRNVKRTIILNLLPKEENGTRDVSKRDILMLLWMLAVQLWTFIGGRADAATLQKRVDDFASTANYLLNLAQLQEFYWPHPLEYSMLLSILSGSAVNMMYDYLLTNVETDPL